MDSGQVNSRKYRCMPGRTPAVETLILRGAKCIAWRWSVSLWSAGKSASVLSKGSPMPMNTRLVNRFVSGTCRIWVRICSVDNCACSFIAPVLQNRHPILQPAWVDTHSVWRFFSGMYTVSTAILSENLKRYLRVLSGASIQEVGVIMNYRESAIV